MNWENYKELTTKQKEEYDFRFNDREEFNIWGLSIIAMNLFLIIILLIFTSYIVVTSPAMEQYQHDVSELIGSAGYLMLVIMIFIIGYIIDFIVRVSIRWWQYSKWKKENNIVIKVGWKKWFK